jgi:hypothetical protein
LRRSRRRWRAWSRSRWAGLPIKTELQALLQRPIARIEKRTVHQRRLVVLQQYSLHLRPRIPTRLVRHPLVESVALKVEAPIPQVDYRLPERNARTLLFPNEVERRRMSYRSITQAFRIVRRFCGDTPAGEAVRTLMALSKESLQRHDGETVQGTNAARPLNV